MLRSQRCQRRGAAVTYFWVHEGVVEQQVEIYDAGVMLAYDRYHLEYDFGMLIQGLSTLMSGGSFELDIDTYQREVEGKPYNRRS